MKRSVLLISCLLISIALFSQETKITNQDLSNFFPKPKVDSVVLQVTNLFAEKLEPDFYGFIRGVFSQRRKTALNAATSALDAPKQLVFDAFTSSRIDPSLRPENLDLGQFASLYQNISLLLKLSPSNKFE